MPITQGFNGEGQKGDADSVTFLNNKYEFWLDVVNGRMMKVFVPLHSL